MTSSPAAPPLTTGRPLPPSSAVALHAGFFLTGVVTALLGALLPAIRVHYNVDVDQVAFLFVVQFVGSSFGSLISQFRIRVSIGVGLALICLGVTALPFASWQLAHVAVFGFGLGLGLVIPATNMLVAYAQRETRAASLNVLNLFWGAGAATSPIIVAALYDRLGLTGTLLTIGIPAAIICTSFIVAPAPTPQAVVARAARTGARATRLQLVFCLLLFLYIGVETSIGGWITTYVSTITADSRWMTWSLAGYWIALLAGRAFAPLLLRHVSERLLLCLTLALGTLGFSGLLLAHSAPLALTFSAVTGLGLAPMFALLLSMLSRYSEAKNAAVPGWLFACAGLGGAAIPWMVGFISGQANSIRLGLGTALCAVLLIAAILSLLEGPQPHSSDR